MIYFSFASENIQAAFVYQWTLREAVENGQ